MDSFARPPAVRCRGGARPSRRNAADPHGLPIKTCRPIASVFTAAGSNRLCSAGRGMPRPYNGGCRTAVPSRDCHVGLRPPRNDKSGSLPLNVQKAPRVRRSDCRKSLAEFAPAGAKKMEIIFSGGVYVGENTARLANVRRACPSCAAASRSPFQTRAQ